MNATDAGGHCGCTGACSCGSAGAAGTEPVLPGDGLVFRHSAIRERLLDQVARTTVDGLRPLTGLGTRAAGDPAIALIDAAAGSAHVLARTLGRLYADSTLTRTADDRALALLTGLLGYQPRPAISAVADLVATVDDLADPDAVVTLPKGTKVASIPAQDELPVTFETDAAMEAHAAWNSLAPVRQPLPQTIALTTAEVTVEGSAFPARPGDNVLVRMTAATATEAWLLARVLAARSDPVATPPATRLTLGGQKALPEGTAFTPAAAGQVMLLAARAQAFGAGAANLALMSDAFRDTQKANPSDPRPTEWKDLVMDKDGATNGWQVHLDAIYGDAAVDRAALFDSAEVSGAPHLARISAVRETSRTDFGLSAKCTLITVAGLDLGMAGYNTKVRSSLILLETARAPLTVGLAEATVPSDAAPDRIEIVGEVPMSPGRRILLSGPAAADGTTLTEAAVVDMATSAGGNTTLVFDADLIGRWRVPGLTVHGNAVAASQGETPSSGVEVLGSASAASPMPRYSLSQVPVAHVPASGPRGYAPALEVRVSGRLYAHQDSLWREPEDSLAYRLGTRPDGKAEIQFAARLPGGTNNVTALYRKGGGLAGNLAAGRLSMVLTPVPGVRGVVNLAAAQGGSDAETLEDMRRAAPAAVRTLDRAVSLNDYEAVAAGYRGVGKALASDLSLGLRRVVCVTVATTTLTPPDATLIGDLGQAITAVAPPGISLRVVGFEPLAVVLDIAMASDPLLRRGRVEDDVRTALTTAFGPAARGFGLALHRSQVLAVIQDVPGVIAAMVTGLRSRTAAGVLTEADPTGRLDCPGPKFVGTALVQAGLLSVAAAADIAFAEMAA